MRPRVLCFGAGGHASVVIDLLQLLASRGEADLVGIVAPADATTVLGVPVLGADDKLKQVAADSGATHFIVGIGTLRGGAPLRPRLFTTGLDAGLAPFTAVHPSAIVARSAVLEQGAAVLAGAIIQPRVRVGMNAIVNTRASVDHDCAIGAHAHLAPGVTCSGGVRIGENAHIGTGAVIIENVSVGAGATVGAGAVVIADCEAGTTVAGVPARPIGGDRAR